MAGLRAQALGAGRERSARRRATSSSIDGETGRAGPRGPPPRAAQERAPSRGRGACPRARSGAHRAGARPPGAVRGRMGQVLGKSPADPYALALDVPDPTSDPRQQPQQRGAAPAPTPAQPAAAVTQQIGDRAAAALQAGNSPGFVAALVTGTFQAIVDATAQQVREYANLVASVSKSVDDFSRDNVTPNQVRDWLAARHPADVAVVLPEPGKPGDPRLVPRPGRAAESPPWLADYGLRGQELTDEL